jgi:hypothetical protein
MRLLYLYPEEWTGRSAREVHTLSTCVALAEIGVEVTLVTAGGEDALRDLLLDVADAPDVPGLQLVALSHTLGPIQSTSIFSRDFIYWVQNRPRFDLALIVHLKAGPILTQVGILYAYEAHEIVAQTPENTARQRILHKLEAHVLNAATLHLATSAPLAVALCTWFALSKDFAIVPSAGMPPMSKPLGTPDGPFVYCGSIAQPENLAALFHAARDTKVPLKIIGGTEQEWDVVCAQLDTGGIEWQPYVRLHDLPEALAGARTGLIPTNPDSPSGEFSCPMKLFDYARCGLPVISTALPSLQSLDVGSWCTQIPSPGRPAWKDALKNFKYQPEQAEAARAWSAEHTWAKRAELLKRTFIP